MTSFVVRGRGGCPGRGECALRKEGQLLLRLYSEFSISLLFLGNRVLWGDTTGARKLYSFLMMIDIYWTRYLPHGLNVHTLSGGIGKLPSCLSVWGDHPSVPGIEQQSCLIIITCLAR